MDINRNVIDLHCDTLSECLKQKVSLRNDCLHFSLDKLPQGFRLCQAMAIFMPDELRGDDAVEYFEAVYEIFEQQMKKYDGELARVTDLAKIEDALEQNRAAAFLTVEGGSALCGKAENVERLYALGVRMMTLTWNAENEICGGSSTDLGFTKAGREIVAEMERIGMIVDVSHLSDRGFWELCEFSKKPFIASHSNLRACCNHPRNLTDDMFKEIVRRGGLAGINYYKMFLRGDAADGTIDDLLRHVHRFLELGGEDSLALGSDFDGCTPPDYLGQGIASIGYIAESIEKSGVSRHVTGKILYENASDYFKRFAKGIKV